jgi:hypothetical protein
MKLDNLIIINQILYIFLAILFFTSYYYNISKLHLLGLGNITLTISFLLFSFYKRQDKKYSLLKIGFFILLNVYLIFSWYPFFPNDSFLILFYYIFFLLNISIPIFIILTYNRSIIIAIIISIMEIATISYYNKYFYLNTSLFIIFLFIIFILTYIELKE